MQELARWLNPAAASPSAPRETVAALDAFGPSLMPRTATLHGVAMGLGMLGARATTGVVEKLTRLAVPADASLPAQLVARGLPCDLDIQCFRFWSQYRPQQLLEQRQRPLRPVRSHCHPHRRLHP